MYMCHNFLGYFLFLASLIDSISGYGQASIKRYVQSEIKSIPSLRSGNPDDLLPIREAVGDSRIVMLGEQSHGDGTTFLAKAKLIKYLHEQMGFNVLAFESDFFALTEGWEQASQDSAVICQFFKENLYPIWSYSEECSPLLYEYIPQSYQTAHPLKIAGFDNQMHGRYTADLLKEALDTFLSENRSRYYESEEYKTFFLPFLDTLLPLNYKSTHYLDSLVKTDFIKKTVAAFIALENLKDFASEIYNHGKRTSHNTREQRMAKNLKWLIEDKYPYEKIIVWAANLHIMKNGEIAFKNPGLRIASMGTYFSADSILTKQTYILGFTSHYGKTQTALKAAQNIPATVLKKRRSNDFENWIDQEIKYGFVDFKSFKKKNPNYADYFKLKARGHSPIDARWTDLFDGIFFIREMQPSHILKRRGL
jgi:erythromycin esterase